MKCVPQNELEREARRFLPLLARPGAAARRCGVKGRGVKCGEDYGIFAKATQKRPGAHCEARILDAMALEGWVEVDSSEEWTVTPEGARWMARRMDGDEGFRNQHRALSSQNVEMPDRTVRPVRVNEAEDPLYWLSRRKGADGAPFLTDEMVAAGERVRSDFTRAQLAQGVTTDWSRIHQAGAGRSRGSASGAAEISDAAMAARRRLDAALDCLGPEMPDVVLDVCCFQNGLGEAEKVRGWPQRSAKLGLRLALGLLARHYGLIASGETGRRSPRIGAWRKAGARPRIDGDGAGGSDAVD